MYYLYILQSLKRKRFYIGVTKDREKRLEYHNNGKVRSTKPYTPWIMIYYESYKDKEAYKREFFLKHSKGYLEKLNILETYSK